MQPPNDWDPANHPAYLLGRAARLFARAADDRLAKLGVSSAHVPVIRLLNDGKARSQAELAELVKVEQPTMAQLLARMERDGLIKRAPNPDDGRSSLFSLTPRAQSKVRAVRDVLVKGSDEMFDGFSAGQIAMLATLLEQAIENLEAAASKR
ncbi:MAG TPA: MarR family transcriptional regulator [Kofleriaceae bacterium]|jgi:DNA-binding MarR family transcriptional regulator|nr:MarR family transcriptional regulator [Kofleriaceae bacterium]